MHPTGPMHSSLLAEVLANSNLLSHKHHEIFQGDVLKLSVWADVWQMKFSVMKCCILQVSTPQSTSDYNIILYTMYRTPLKVVKDYHYLGVLLNEKYTPHKLNLQES